MEGKSFECLPILRFWVIRDVLHLCVCRAIPTYGVYQPYGMNTEAYKSKSMDLHAGGIKCSHTEFGLRNGHSDCQLGLP